MRGAIIYGAGDVRCEERPDPLIIEPTDAIVRAAATCVCGRICGATAASMRSPNRGRSVMSTAVS